MFSGLIIKLLAVCESGGRSSPSCLPSFFHSPSTPLVSLSEFWPMSFEEKQRIDTNDQAQPAGWDRRTQLALALPVCMLDCWRCAPMHACMFCWFVRSFVRGKVATATAPEMKKHAHQHTPDKQVVVQKVCTHSVL